MAGTQKTHNVSRKEECRRGRCLGLLRAFSQAAWELSAVLWNRRPWQSGDQM